MKTNTRRTMARFGTALAAAALILGATACGGDDDTSADTEAPTDTEAPPTTEAPAPTEAPPTTVAPVPVTPGLWVEAVVRPPVAVCLYVSEAGTSLVTPPDLDPVEGEVATECIGGLEVEFAAVPECPNGKLSIKGTPDTETPFNGSEVVIEDANGTATVTFGDAEAATVVATSLDDPACTYTFEMVKPGTMEDIGRPG